MARPTAFNPEEKLHQAMKLFWQKGYSRTSMQEIVDRLEINRFSVYNTFGDKRQLFIKSLRLYLDSVFSQLIAPLGGNAPGKQRLDAYLDNLGRKLQRHGGRLGCLMQNTGIELSGSNDESDDNEIHAPLRAMYNTLHGELERAFWDARRELELADNRDPLQCALHVLTSVQGLIVLRRTLDQPELIATQINFLRDEVKGW